MVCATLLAKTYIIINTQKNLVGTVEISEAGMIWHITSPIVKDVYYGDPTLGDIPATWIDEANNEQMAIIRPTNNFVYLDRGLSGEIGEIEVPKRCVDIISSADGYTTKIRYPPYYGEGVTFISPTGSDPITEATCVNVVALLKDGKKYWLTPEIHVELCSPPWTEIPLSTFHSYPDGTTSIIVRGVTIPPRSTASICPIPISISEVNAYWSGITAWVSWVQDNPGKVKIIIDSVVWKTSYDGAAGINSLPIGQSPAINDTLDHTVCIEVF
ncbi:hypothetical protein KKF82_08940 [Patescibacteria group bacterium]|nr:hypothetical protein [Patescibacteria group bacterium]